MQTSPSTSPAARKARREYRKAHNLCLDCPAPVEPNHARCQRCMGKRAGSKDRTHDIALQRQRRANRQANGLCVHCNAPAIPGRARCAQCSRIAHDRDSRPVHRRYKSRWSEEAMKCILHHLRQDEPILRQHWTQDIVDWISQHIFLWWKPYDPVCDRAVELVAKEA